MSELKTLKDIGIQVPVYEAGRRKPCYKIHQIDANNLRQEAIKWHKHLKKVKSPHDVWDFIETFFNIKKRNLK